MGPHSSHARPTGAVPARRTILVVDDDAAVVGLLADLLEEQGYRVASVGRGADALAAVSRVRPDLVILDILLPDADGLLLCERLAARRGPGVVVLSGSGRESDRLLSLRLGADDFIAKPFDTAELVARVQAVLRRAARSAGLPARRGRWDAGRSGRGAGGPIQVGELAIDPRRRRVAVSDRPIHLTPTEQRLLTALASEPERVLGRGELAGLLWGHDSVGNSRALDVHIRRLRVKLAPFGAAAPLVVTVRGFGYTLSA